MQDEQALAHLRQDIAKLHPYRIYGRVNQVVGLVIEGKGPVSSVGDSALIYPLDEGPPIHSEVVGFRDGRTLLMPLGDLRGIGVGSRILSKKRTVSANVGDGLLGRVVDRLGSPMDGKGPLNCAETISIHQETTNPMKKRRITQPLDLGVRSINGLLTCGRGQRMGIFAGSGVGKSVLLGMIAQHTEAKVNVIGREVREFIEKDLGEGLGHSVVVVATSDQPPLIRVRAAFLTIALAEYFRDRGNDVLLLMDSLTRFSMAQREIGLAIGEPPTTKGYTPSVFFQLAKLLERAGNGEGDGTMTAIYTVLVEGDDLDDPIADAARSILDGHIVLSRKLANANHYPAVDVLKSISRIMKDIVSSDQRDYAAKMVEVLSEYEKAEDLINIGAYVAGSNKKIDYAISMVEKIRIFLKQKSDEKVDLEKTIDSMKILFYV
jgi:flagellum-specific ATP synthase